VLVDLLETTERASEIVATLGFSAMMSDLDIFFGQGT
jgi:hypothetical protein